DSRPLRHRRSCRSSLCPAGDAALQGPGDSARFFCVLQHEGRSRRPDRRHPQGHRGIFVNPELRDLYQEVIVDHSKRPRNFHKLAAGTSAEGYNPLCGDRVTVYVDADGDVVRDVSFEGCGCAISTASASVMTEVVKGKSRAEAKKLFDTFHTMVTK